MGHGKTERRDEAFPDLGPAVSAQTGTDRVCGLDLASGTRPGGCNGRGIWPWHLDLSNDQRAARSAAKGTAVARHRAPMKANKARHGSKARHGRLDMPVTRRGLLPHDPTPGGSTGEDRKSVVKG